MRAITSLTLVLLSLSTNARANGGPVQMDFAASGRGGVTPLDHPKTRLVEEQLHIALEPDGEHYRVTARYVLANDRTRRVTYGVPIAWGDPSGMIARRS